MPRQGEQTRYICSVGGRAVEDGSLLLGPARGMEVTL